MFQGSPSSIISQTEALHFDEYAPKMVPAKNVLGILGGQLLPGSQDRKNEGFPIFPGFPGVQVHVFPLC